MDDDPASLRFVLDPAALDAYLQSHVAGYRGPSRASRLTGGQSNPTYRLDTPAKAYVLRGKPPGPLLPSAHAVDREYRVLRALAGGAVPVPATHHYCADETVIGTSFYIMEWVAGRIFWDPTLPGMTPAGRGAIYDAMNATLAALHRVDYEAVGLADYGRPGNYFARQIGRWSKQYRASETAPVAAMDKLIAWLPENVPPGEETAIVHGDYRLDNLIFHESEPRVLAVLDWELSTLGHPLADLSYNCMAWRLSPELFRGIAGVDLKSLGIPSEEAYVEAYCRRVGRPAAGHWRFYMAYNMFRLAAILQGIVGRARQGSAVGSGARDMAAKVEPIAELAWAEVRAHV